jgi:NitT/TauT family transport system ATP-binding protein
MSRLSIRKVRLAFPRRGQPPLIALDDIDITLPDKQFAVIVGPSGCGKSSLLYLVAGLTEPSGGELLLDGRRIEGSGRDRGMVFQSYTLFPWLTVRGNVAFGLRLRGVADAEVRAIVDRYIREVGLNGFEDAYPKQLSGGMMQRVALARAMANDPEILLMDEPFGALDSQTRLVMQQLLLRVWEHEHKTVLFVTHDIDEAIFLGDRVFVMTARPGRIKEEITVDLPRPRAAAVTLTPQFIAIKQRILGLLQEEVNKSLGLAMPATDDELDAESSNTTMPSLPP